MNQSPPQLRKRIEQEELFRLWEELEGSIPPERMLPDSRTLPLRRFRTVLEDVTSMSLGVLLGVFVLLLNFLIFIWLLHIGS